MFEKYKNYFFEKLLQSFTFDSSFRIKDEMYSGYYNDLLFNDCSLKKIEQYIIYMGQNSFLTDEYKYNLLYLIDYMAQIIVNSDLPLKEQKQYLIELNNIRNILNLANGLKVDTFFINEAEKRIDMDHNQLIEASHYLRPTISISLRYDVFILAIIINDYEVDKNTFCINFPNFEAVLYSLRAILNDNKELLKDEKIIKKIKKILRANSLNPYLTEEEQKNKKDYKNLTKSLRK